MPNQIVYRLGEHITIATIVVSTKVFRLFKA